MMNRQFWKRTARWIPITLVMVALALTGSAAAQDITDDITRAIENELLKDELVDSNAIDVVTQSGIVRATGTVEDMLTRERVQRIAEHVVGVRGVVNQIMVDAPGYLTDQALKQDVVDALRLDPAADSYEVSVQAKNGGVTLEGSVNSWQEKELCSTVAKRVPGVEWVQNNLVVEYTEDRPDLEIKTDIESRLANDILVDDYLIRVQVTDNRVTLSGTVGSLAEKSQAIRDAWVLGTNAVNADGLQIQDWARDEMRRKDLYVQRTDQEIEDAVNDALFYDPRVSGTDVRVFVDNGTVMLSGIVDNLPANVAAQNSARNVIGVWRVKNYIKVRPPSTPDNDELKSRVASKLLADPTIDRADVTVDVHSGTVYLRGTVNSDFEKERAETLAGETPGVVQVVNTLKYEHLWLWRPDWEIRENVKEELFWSPFVDQSDITVKVDRGVVTLAGTVDTWSEKRAAEDNAFAGGAKDVRNELSVTFPVYGPHLYMMDS